MALYNDILDPSFDKRRMMQVPQVGPYIYDTSGVRSEYLSNLGLRLIIYPEPCLEWSFPVL